MYNICIINYNYYYFIFNIVLRTRRWYGTAQTSALYFARVYTIDETRFVLTQDTTHSPLYITIVLYLYTSIANAQYTHTKRRRPRSDDDGNRGAKMAKVVVATATRTSDQTKQRNPSPPAPAHGCARSRYYRWERRQLPPPFNLLHRRFCCSCCYLHRQRKSDAEWGYE